jgi:NADH-quinone oxidoreductase subunit N
MNINFSSTDFFAIGPLLVLFGFSLLLLLIEAFVKDAKKYISLVAFIGLALALCVAIISPASTNPLLTDWLKFDGLSRFFTIFFLAIGLGTVLLSSAFFKRFEATHGEYYFLLFSALFGLLLLSSSNDFLTLFLGLETLSISLYVLCGYMKKWTMSHEAAFKYFLLGSMSTAFLLFGIALVYGAVGTTRLDSLLPALQKLPSSNQTLFLGGIALVTLGLLFKAAVVPFHVWAPDVYAGSPTPVTAFMAVATKAGAFAALIRVFLQTFQQFDPHWNQALALFAYPTLIYANFVAIRQTQLRAFFAYSGISHAGYLLLPLAAATPDSAPAMLFYIVVYTIATLGCFAVIAFLDNKSDGVMLNDLRGLFYTSPFLAGIFSLCLLTLAGIPPTIGFFAKFYIFKVAFSAGYYGLVTVGLLTTILAAFYYLRIVAVMFSDQTVEEIKPLQSRSATLAGVLSFAFIVVLSCFPDPLLELFNRVCRETPF